MPNILFICALFIIPGVLATAWDNWLSKDISFRSSIAKWAFNSLTIDLALYMLKIIRGEGDFTIISSFSGIPTILKYFIPAVILAIALPVIMNFRLTKRIRSIFSEFFNHPLAYYSIIMLVLIVVFLFDKNSSGKDLLSFDSIYTFAKYSALCLFLSILLPVFKLTLPIKATSKKS